MPRLDPDVARTRSAVRTWLDADPAHRAGAVLVACSGGSDSLALAAATAFEARRSGVRAGAVVVDHGLQAGSADVAAAAADQCRGLGLDPVIVRRARVSDDGGPEGAARAARYAELELAAAEVGSDGRPGYVLLGHTADDQAETVLLRLARGSGSRSLAGIPPGRGVLARPFLGLRREQLRRACTAQGLTWWEDPTNAVDGPLRRADGGDLPRAAVRERVLPALVEALGADPVPALVRTAELLREDAELLDLLAAQLLARVQGEDASLDLGALAEAPGPLRRRALRVWLVAAGSAPGALGLGHVAAVEELVTAWRGQRGVDVPGDLRVRRVSDRLQVVPRRDLL